MSKKIYWKGVEQLTNDPEFIKNAEKEFPEHLPIKDAYGDNSGEEDKGSTRRDFLKLMGFSVAAVSMAACEAPVRKAIPYLNKPENVDPGIPNYYASTYVDGSDYCPIVVKTREGRPIFIEGNTFSNMTAGGTNPRVNASVLSLYDNEKIKYPTKGGDKADWATIDGEIKQALSGCSNIRIVSNTIVSPSTKKVINDFIAKYPSTKHVTYDQESASGILEANQQSFGKAVVPAYDFSKAEVIVSIGADFLGTWISGVEYTSQYVSTRKVGKDKKEMSQHFQFETMMSLTGSNADYRTPIKPSQEGLVVAKLYNLIAASGAEQIGATDIEVSKLSEAAEALLAAKGKSLVVSGSNDVNVQILVNKINELLGNYGTTLDIEKPSFQKQGSDKAINSFVNELASGSVDGVIFYNCNPVYDYARSAEIASAIPNLKLSVATGERLDETASLVTYNCPDSHFLESWNDFEPKKGVFSIGQPTISTIFDTRQVQQSLLTWAEVESSYEDYIKAYWEETLYPLQSKELMFQTFWYRILHDGIFEPANATYTSVHEGASAASSVASEGDELVEDVISTSSSVDLGTISSAIQSKYKADSSELELVVYSGNVLGTGSQANNPMLQETPDPISRVTWGNFVAVTQSKATELGLSTQEIKTSTVKLSVNGVECELPVVIQPGLAKGTVAVMLGYGKPAKTGGRVAEQAGGFNAFKFTTVENGVVNFASTTGVSLSATGAYTTIALVQTHNTVMGRESIIQETLLSEYKKNPKAGALDPKITGYSGEMTPGDVSLWEIDGKGYGEKEYRKGEKEEELQPDSWNNRVGLKGDRHDYINHHWGMSIDLNSCTGCAACVVACHLENNVPVVGKQEVINRREMHWIRIDRYYSTSEGATSYKELEKAVENPEVVFQPMMCQHCNNAPCETVCPVAATTHSAEGLNQMTYNRCIGTKYCANNCPYKVRRFNWFKYHNNNEFDYHLNNDLGKMVLNPDVTVRSRGVMEKCSLCVQRIQGGKLQAKIEGRQLRDGDASTACASVCPANAITFGDLNDTKSEVRTQMESELDGRAYTVLEEINVRPNVWYLRKVRNKVSENA